jgi:hypothetical protein
MNVFLYPGKTRTELELDLQLFTAALYLAASEVTGGDPQAVELQLRAWLARCPDVAVRAAMLRQRRELMAFEGVPQ